MQAPASPQILQAHKKCAMKMKERRKNVARKNVIDHYKAHTKNWVEKMISTSFESTILDIAKVLVNWPRGWFFERGHTNRQYA